MIGPIARFNAMQGIAGVVEDFGVSVSCGVPLSGYLAGQARGGRKVCELEDAFASVFHMKHAIAVNSATSGLLAAAFAAGLGPGDTFACPAMTMSATAAAPMFTGAKPFFCDVSDEDFALAGFPGGMKAVFATNLFGHPAMLHALRDLADKNGAYLIEDNAQSPMATENGKFAGTIGHIGVFSFNVHKHLQCGEGGMVVTNDDALAGKLRAFINHGEHVAENIGLNLRMPEVSAAIMLAQLARRVEIIASRVEQAHAIISAIGKIPGLRPPVVREGCSHVYYTIPFVIDGGRPQFCEALKAEGVPIVEGYVEPLYRLPAFSSFFHHCPVAEGLHERRLFYIENCAYSFSPEQIRMIGDAFKRAAEKVL